MLDLSLPTGLRDLLPDHSAHLAELSARLQEVFSRFGYRRLFLPTLERLDVVERGLSPAALKDVMKFVEPGSGEVVAIRPDITPQIARLRSARAGRARCTRPVSSSSGRGAPRRTRRRSSCSRARSSAWGSARPC